MSCLGQCNKEGIFKSIGCPTHMCWIVGYTKNSGVVETPIQCIAVMIRALIIETTTSVSVTLRYASVAGYYIISYRWFPIYFDMYGCHAMKHLILIIPGHMISL